MVRERGQDLLNGGGRAALEGHAMQALVEVDGVFAGHDVLGAVHPLVVLLAHFLMHTQGML